MSRRGQYPWMMTTHPSALGAAILRYSVYAGGLIRCYACGNWGGGTMIEQRLAGETCRGVAVACHLRTRLPLCHQCATSERWERAAWLDAPDAGEPEGDEWDEAAPPDDPDEVWEGEP